IIRYINLVKTIILQLIIFLKFSVLRGKFFKLRFLQHEWNHMNEVIYEIFLYILSEESGQSYDQSIRIIFSYPQFQLISVIAIWMETLRVYSRILIHIFRNLKYIYCGNKHQPLWINLCNILFCLKDKLQVLIRSIICQVFLRPEARIYQQIRSSTVGLLYIF